MCSRAGVLHDRFQNCRDDNRADADTNTNTNAADFAPEIAGYLFHPCMRQVRQTHAR